MTLKATRLIPKTFCINERTPQALYDELNKEFRFDFDPCPLNPIPLTDGLTVNWGKRCFINPPYGKAIRVWLEKAIVEIDKGNTNIAVFLLPAYTDVKWFHEIVLPKAKDVRYLKGRLKFGDHDNSAPFASMICVFEG